MCDSVRVLGVESAWMGICIGVFLAPACGSCWGGAMECTHSFEGDRGFLVGEVDCD